MPLQRSAPDPPGCPLRSSELVFIFGAGAAVGVGPFDATQYSQVAESGFLAILKNWDGSIIVLLGESIIEDPLHI
jgi:hypothetical protein